MQVFMAYNLKISHFCTVFHTLNELNANKT